MVLAGFKQDPETARQGLSSSSPEVRASALCALARAGHLEAGELEGGFADADPAVRRRACELAAHVASAAAEELLGAALADAEASVAEVAAFALGERVEVRPTTVEALAEMARHHPAPLCREAAVVALGAVGDPRGLPSIMSALGDKPAVRLRAVVALAAYDGPDVARALQKAGSDPDWQVRQAAEDLMGRPR